MKRVATWKRAATWAFYAVSALAIVYLALYAYAMFSRARFEPGDPIHIFRNPEAPSYSWLGKGALTPRPPSRHNIQRCAKG